jgi:5'-nucleotidase
MHRSIGRTFVYSAALSAALTSAPAARAHEGCEDDASSNDPAVRASAARRVEWISPDRRRERPPVRVQILGFNDFHGQLSAGRLVTSRPVGGAAVLASYLKSEQSAFAGTTFIAHAGDHVGASPAASALLQDEPSIAFLNLLGNAECDRRFPDRECNVIGTLGNHEFDEGVDEMLRLIKGGNHANGPFLERRYKGASFPYVCANVVRQDNGKPILPPYVIRRAGRSKIAFIGAVLEQTPTIVTPTGVAGVRFLDEADAINKYIPEIRRKGVEAIVVLIHQGGTQTSYVGPTADGAAINGADINGIVSRLDSSIDVVVSGHAHSFSNALVPNAAGHPILVVQAFSASTAYDDVELSIDPVTHDVVEKSASIVTTFADVGPGLTPDAAVAALVTQAEQLVAPLVNEVVAEAAAAITRAQNAEGESALGNLIADSQRAAMGTEFGFMNPGGIRADIAAGEVTWGELFTVQPFGNSLVKLTMTGAQIYALLEQQWAGQPFPRILQISGLSYTWDAAAAVGSRVLEVRKGGVAIDPAATYTVTANNFIAAGGDNFTVFTQGNGNVGGPVDLDALIAYLEGLPQPFNAAIEGRIVLSIP